MTKIKFPRKDMTRNIEQHNVNAGPSLEELIWSYNQRQEKLAIEMVMNFESMFENEPPSISEGPWEFTDISSQESFKQFRPGRGFYLILSDYVPPWDRKNACTLTVEGLPVLYRGQADKVQERLMSHLDNHRYLQMKQGSGQSAWERCLKLDEVKGNKGGINLEEAPFSDARWAAVVLPMPESTSRMRELVEWAFDRVFGKPVASNERKKIPQAVKAAIDEHQARGRAMALALENLLKEASL